MANLELVSANIGTSMLSISDMLRTDVVGLWRGVLWGYFAVTCSELRLDIPESEHFPFN